MNAHLHSDKRNPSTGCHSYIPLGMVRGQDQGVLARLEGYETLSDQELLRLIAQRNREALEVLYDRHGNAVYSLAVYMLRDPGAAEEVTQDAFFNLWRRASSYQPERGKVTTWLFSIAHHRVIDEVRRRRRREPLQAFQDVELVAQPADESGDPSRFAMLQMQRSKIKEALSTLRSEQREVVVLAFYGGLTHSEIAKQLGKPLGTVKTRMRLALKKLRNVLDPRSQEWA